jgi:hypothetical protein
MRYLVHTLSSIALMLAIATTLSAQQHQSQFELTEAFVTNWAHHPVQDLEVTLACAGPVHPAATDCELHIGAQVGDPSISDFQGVVLEPPNVCTNDGSSLRSHVNSFEGKDCVGHGFIRAWPEHLKSGSGCSNPNHFMEMHPLQTLTCAGTSVLDYTQKLGVVPGLGFKPASTVRNMLTMLLWSARSAKELRVTRV